MAMEQHEWEHSYHVCQGFLGNEDIWLQPWEVQQADRISRECYLMGTDLLDGGWGRSGRAQGSGRCRKHV